MHALKTLGVELDRKMLAEMAVRDQAAFTELANRAQRAVEGQPPPANG